MIIVDGIATGWYPPRTPDRLSSVEVSGAWPYAANDTLVCMLRNVSINAKASRHCPALSSTPLTGQSLFRKPRLTWVCRGFCLSRDDQ